MQKRNEAIANRIIEVLKEHPRTIGNLHALTKIDLRTITRHLCRLMAEGRILYFPQTKVVERDHGRSTTWEVKYYYLKSDGAAPLDLLKHSPIPEVAKIHNPFKGDAGVLRIIRFLRDPVGPTLPER